MHPALGIIIQQVMWTSAYLAGATHRITLISSTVLDRTAFPAIQENTQPYKLMHYCSLVPWPCWALQLLVSLIGNGSNLNGGWDQTIFHQSVHKIQLA